VGLGNVLRGLNAKSGIDAELLAVGRLATSGYFIGLHIRFTSPLVIFQTYDQRWVDHYTENGLVLRDPATLWGMSRTGAIRWSDPHLSDPFNLLPVAASFGLRFGMTVACGTSTSRSIASFARNDREFAEGEFALIAASVQRLHDLHDRPRSLTAAQVAALRCLAGGDRHADAAERLGISESALKARLTSARERLMARTTAEAIRRARDYRLI
jgi:LuxR family transcriptional regulator, quorum-sensing system regulator SdiA